MENLSGRMIKGYQLMERIGAGAFGAVYRSYQSTVGREVALKIILPGFANHPSFIRRFEMEAQLIARLEHIHMVTLYDYWRDPSGAYLAMRWLRGGSLKEAIQERPFSVREAARLMDQVGSALAAAHRNDIVHRDLKPSNILLDEEGNAYLADFGIALDTGMQAGSAAETEPILGSPAYLSPEQARRELVTPRSDIYSLGVTLYEMLTGKHPFAGASALECLYKHINEALPPIETLDPEIQEGVNEIVQKATAKNPRQRYQDIFEMVAAFQEAVHLGEDGQNKELVESLTPREQQILGLIVQGRTNKQIAQGLFVEASTVKWYITQIYRKMGVRSRVQAMVRARELDLIQPGGDSPAAGAGAHTIEPGAQMPPNPYKGLRAFEAADSRDFYGREALTKRLVNRLGEEDYRGRFLAIVGPSGSGKSSLVKAGLIPALHRSALPGSEDWFIVAMTPGSRPLEALEVALTRVSADMASNIHGQLESGERGLLRVAGLILPNDGSDLLIVIDQFEDLFSLVEEEAARRHFLDLLYAAVTDSRSRVRVVITLRADFYDRPLHYADFGELLRRRMETVLPLSAEELERAIRRPAESVGIRFEPGLVATIIDEINYQPGALPLLQYALTELFENRQDDLLSYRAYRDIGGAAGALARRAEEIYQDLS
ncbi:MAG TPA: protein kinase, partial [Anaerolineales bacterium]